MLLLSSVAERVYWMARYLERAEDTARLVNVYTGLMLDLPRGVQLGWDRLVAVMGVEAAFRALGGDGEAGVTEFVLRDARNPSSVVGCLAAARENVRTTRHVLPAELWEAVNALHRHAFAADAGATRSARHRFLTRIVEGCQQIAGLLDGTMPRDEVHEFVRLGKLLERADMTSRVLDVGVVAAPVATGEPAAVEGIVWVHVLRALSAYQAFRRTGVLGAPAREVAAFLLCAQTFPRSVRFCVVRLARALTRLPRHEAPLAQAQALLARLDALSLANGGAQQLLGHSDALQIDLGALHEAIGATWFRVGTRP